MTAQSEGDGAPEGRDNDGIHVARDGSVLRIVIDRPARKGSLDPGAVRRIIEALEEAATDDRLRAVLLSSAGDDFCAGADWVARNRDAEDKPRTGSIQRRTAVQAHRLIEVVLELQLPVVCAVRGFAVGLGCQLALAADFTIATEDSTFWLPFTKRGFTPDSAATWLVPRLVGIARAKELLLLARRISGVDAASWGMIYRAVPGADLDNEVNQLVDELASAASVAIGLTKRTIHAALQSGIIDAMEREALALELSSRSADFREGLAAFVERRDARFTGR